MEPSQGKAGFKSFLVMDVGLQQKKQPHSWTLHHHVSRGQSQTYPSQGETKDMGWWLRGAGAPPQRLATSVKFKDHRAQCFKSPTEATVWDLTVKAQMISKAVPLKALGLFPPKMQYGEPF